MLCLVLQYVEELRGRWWSMHLLALRPQGGEGSWRLVDCRAGCSHLVPFCGFLWDFTVSHLPPLN